jgi:hypothetical protein
MISLMLLSRMTNWVIERIFDYQGSVRPHLLSERRFRARVVAADE